MHYPTRLATLVLVCLATLAGCGGGGGGGGSTAGNGGGGVSNDPCSITARNQWVIDTMREWYLYPTLLPATVSASAYNDPQALIDAMTATARAQNKDRYFTYITSIAQENAFFNSGATAGFGIRLQYDSANARLLVTEAFEGAPALTAGIDRGDEITAIGNSTAALNSVAGLFASGGPQAVSDALGPSTAGTTRALRVVGPAGTRTVTVTKADFSLQPVSARYGARILDDAGRRVGYLNLRTFIGTADSQLRSAFATVTVRVPAGPTTRSARVVPAVLGPSASLTACGPPLAKRPATAASVASLAPMAVISSPRSMPAASAGAPSNASVTNRRAFTLSYCKRMPKPAVAPELKKAFSCAMEVM